MALRKADTVSPCGNHQTTTAMNVDAGKHRITQAIKTVLAVASFAVLVFGAHWVAYWLRFDMTTDGRWLALWQGTWPWVLLVKPVVFAGWGQLADWWRAGSFRAAKQMVQASLVATVALVVIDYWLSSRLDVPRSIVLLDWVATVVAIGAVRAVVRTWQEMDLAGWWRGRRPARALIVGSSMPADVLWHAIQRSHRLHYKVVGAVAEKSSPPVARSAGIEQLGTINDLPRLLEHYRIDELLVISDEIPGRRLRELLETAQARGVAVRSVPSYEQLILGGGDPSPRGVSIDDLLRREPVPLDDACLHSWIAGKTVLVTGAAGSIGSEICRQLLRHRPARLLALDRAESGLFMLEQELHRLQLVWAPGEREWVDVQAVLADLNDPLRLRNILRACQPHVIIHAAAYKHVPMLERFPSEAARNIVLATQRLADLAVENAIDSFVLISTDKAVRPSCVMGACKRVAELYVQGLGKTGRCRFITVSFGNVLNSAGSVVPLFQQQIAAGGPVTVTHPEMQRYFMTIPEAAQLVLHAARIGRGGDVMVLDMGEPVRILDLARDMIRLSGLREGHDIQIQFTGLRPGEKLQEELWEPADQVLSTSHPKIVRIVGAECDMDSLREQLAQLRRCVDGPDELVLECLRRMVPEYGRQTRSESVRRRRAA
ncbi:MAG: multidrug MFS transporter [Pirellulaceae bacterium]|nr:MAG: multidrug MFS transporter [Pirellulaceae bacterium]